MKKFLASLGSGAVLCSFLFSFSACTDRIAAGEEDSSSTSDASTEVVYVHHDDEGDPVVWDGETAAEPDTTTEDGATVYWVWTPEEYAWIMDTDNLNAAAEASDIIIRICMCFDFNSETVASPKLDGAYAGNHTVTFEGNYHTFSHMVKEGVAKSSVGLFASFLGADDVVTTLDIENITLDNADFETASAGYPLGAFLGIAGTGGSGVVVGYDSLNLHITGCHVTNSSLATTGTGSAGGIVGRGNSGLNEFTMTDCSVEDTALESSTVGGLVGSIESPQSEDGKEFFIDGCSLSNVDLTAYSTSSSATWDSASPTWYIGQLIGSIGELATVEVTDASITDVAFYLDAKGSSVTESSDTTLAGYIYVDSDDEANDGHLYVDGVEYTL